jgi:asparagine synthase (glutamine-hydrolysing)
VIGRWPDLEPSEFCTRAVHLMKNRGPDSRGSAGFSRDGDPVAVEDPRCEVALVHTRLAVIDLSESGCQPMVDSATGDAIVLNGEIYNYRALARLLPGGPQSLRGTSDTEVALRWLAARREIGLLEGMYALAHLSRAERVVRLSRDEFGIKPLYYAKHANALAFASDISVLMGLPHVNLEEDEDYVMGHLRFSSQLIASDACPVRGIKRLLPGYVLSVSLDAPQGCRASRLVASTVSHPAPSTFSEAVEETRRLFTAAIASHLQADVRIGCALSGGLDSSSILAVMRQQLGPEPDLDAVSHVAEGAKSEERWIRIAAQSVGARLHLVEPTTFQFAEEIDDLVCAHSEPIGGTSLYAQYGVFRRARAEGVVVMLDGQGADELLAGYDYYLEIRLLELLRDGDLISAARLLARLPDSRATSVIRVIEGLIRVLLPTRVTESIGSMVGRPGLPPWVIGDTFAYSRKQEQRRTVALRGLKWILEQSIETGLVALLRHEDQNSMRFSIESRVPFLDRKLSTFLRSLPATYLISREGVSKHVFREAMRGLVPEPIRMRRDKIGFENDEAGWLAAAERWASRVISEDGRRSAHIDSARLAVSWKRFREGDRRLARRLWPTLLYLRWLGLRCTAGRQWA